MLLIGSLNKKAFETGIQQGRLPQEDSITYEGVINTNYFEMNRKFSAKDEEGNDHILDLEIDSCDFNNPFTKQVEKWISILIKTKYDGIGYRKPVDICIVVDKSGSMGSILGNNNKGEEAKSCIELAKEACIKLVEFLNENDRISIIAIDGKSTTILDMNYVKDINSNNIQQNEQDLFCNENDFKQLLEKKQNFKTVHKSEFLTTLNRISAGGGTELLLGYKAALFQYQVYWDNKYQITGPGKENLKDISRERRIIYTTDMNYIDDENFENVIKEASKQNIFTTILGIGVDLNSDFTEKISHNRGCNYFSATEASDLDEILIGKFDYINFPVCHDIKISFMNSDFKLIDSIGTDIKPYRTKNEEEYWTRANHVFQKRKFKNTIESLLWVFKCYRIRKQKQYENEGKKIKAHSQLRKTILARISDFLKDKDIEVTRLHSFFAGPTRKVDIQSKQVDQLQGGLILLRLLKDSKEEENKHSKLTMNYLGLDDRVYSREYFIKMNKNTSPNNQVNSNNFVSMSSNIKKGIVLYSHVVLSKMFITNSFENKEEKEKLKSFTLEIIKNNYDDLKDNDYVKELSDLEIANEKKFNPKTETDYKLDGEK